MRKRYRDPHQGACALLVLQRGQAPQVSSEQVAGVDDAVTESQECRKNVTGQCCEEKIQRHVPSRLRQIRWRLYDWPPEHEASQQKRDVLETMRPVRP